MYDVAIIGTGGAGYSAAIYAARYKMSVLLIGGRIGGTISDAYEIENYLGFEKIIGRELAQKMQSHAEKYDIDLKNDIVSGIQKEGDIFNIKTTQGEYKAKTVIVATGTIHRHLGIPSEEQFAGKGVSYCATCDGFFFRNKDVAIIGGGDSAATAGLYLADICKKIYIVVRKSFMRAEPFWIDALGQKDNVEFVFESNVAEFQGQNKLERVLLDTGRILEVDGAFVEIGADPDTKILNDVKKDQSGYIIVDQAQMTNIEGLFAAGDVTTGSNHFHQLATAVGEGAVAANAAFIYLQKNA